jgi:hypothetical protein
MASVSYKIDNDVKLIQISCNGTCTGGIYATKEDFFIIIFANLITGKSI